MQILLGPEDALLPPRFFHYLGPCDKEARLLPSPSNGSTMTTRTSPPIAYPTSTPPPVSQWHCPVGAVVASATIVLSRPWLYVGQAFLEGTELPQVRPEAASPPPAEPGLLAP